MKTYELRFQIVGDADSSVIALLGALDVWARLLEATKGTPYRLVGYDAWRVKE